MPYAIRKRSGLKPWKIVSRDTGRVVGSSVSRRAAERSVRARLAAERGHVVTRRTNGRR